MITYVRTARLIPSIRMAAIAVGRRQPQYPHPFSMGETLPNQGLFPLLLFPVECRNLASENYSPPN